MEKLRVMYSRRLTRRRTIVGLLSILMVIVLVAAACGEEATPTPVPATATPVPPTATPVPGQPTATPAPPTATPVPQPTATPAPTLRPLAEWTVDNPGTLAEVEAELEKHRGESLVFVSWAGAYQEMQRLSYLDPLRQRFGINVIEESEAGQAVPKIRAMVEAGNVTWDLVDVGMGQAVPLMDGGLLEEIDFSIFDRGGFLLESLNSPYLGAGSLAWTHVLAYNTDYYSQEGRRPPQSWADLWDPGFPGRKGFGDYLSGHMESALLAAGYSQEEVVQPLTLEMEEVMFQALEDLAPRLDVLWSAGSTPPEMLISGELQLSSAWGGRIFDAWLEGAPVAICYECVFMVGVGANVIPKGAPNKELALLAIAYASFPVNQVVIAQNSSYAGTNARTAELLAAVIEPEKLAQLPTAPQNIPFAVVMNEIWQGENWDRINERYLSILQE